MKCLRALFLLLPLFFFLPPSVVAATTPANIVTATLPAPTANQTIPDNRTIPNTDIRYHQAFLWLLFAIGVTLFAAIAFPRKRRRERRYLPLESRPFHRPKVDPYLLNHPRPRTKLPNAPS